MEVGLSHHRQAHNMRPWDGWRDNLVISEQMKEGPRAEQSLPEKSILFQIFLRLSRKSKEKITCAQLHN